MVKRVIHFIHKEIAGIHQAAYILGVFALSSQFLALIRDRMLAHQFGAGQMLDIYYASFRIPDLLFLTVASIVSISVLIPFFVERLEQSKERSKQFVDIVFSFFFVSISILCTGAYIAMPYVTPILFPGFSVLEHEQVIQLSRLLLLSPILLGLSNLLATITQSYQRFVLHALSPLLYNAGIIAGIFFFAPVYGVTGVVYGVLIGAVLHMLIQMPFIISHGFFPQFTFQWEWRTITHLVLHSAPRRIALSINHISVLFLISIASLMASGSIAVFQLSFNLQSVVLSVIGASYSVAAFPALTRLFSKGDTEQFIQQILSAGRHIIFWSLPFSVLFIILRAQIVRTVLGSGKFDWDDTRLTAAALSLFVVSLVFQGLMLLFVRGYYASGNTKIPFIVNICSGIITVITAIILWYLFQYSPVLLTNLSYLLRVSGIENTIVLVLPLSYTIGFIINGVLLWYLFQRHFQCSLATLYRAFGHGILTSGIVGVVSYFGLQVFGSVIETTTTIGIFLQGFLAGIIGIGFGLLILIAIHNRELYEIWEALKKRLPGRFGVISSESSTTLEG